MGRTKVRFEGRPVAGGGSVGAGGPPSAVRLAGEGARTCTRLGARGGGTAAPPRRGRRDRAAGASACTGACGSAVRHDALELALPAAGAHTDPGPVEGRRADRVRTVGPARSALPGHGHPRPLDRGVAVAVPVTDADRGRSAALLAGRGPFGRASPMRLPVSSCSACGQAPACGTWSGPQGEPRHPWARHRPGTVGVARHIGLDATEPHHDPHRRSTEMSSATLTPALSPRRAARPVRRPRPRPAPRWPAPPGRGGARRGAPRPEPLMRYPAAYLAALRAGAAVLALRARPAPKRRASRSVWSLLGDVAPELAEWAAYFASCSDTSAAAEAGIERLVSTRDADDLLRQSEQFLELVPTSSRAADAPARCPIIAGDRHPTPVATGMTCAPQRRSSAGGAWGQAPTGGASTGRRGRSARSTRPRSVVNTADTSRAPGVSQRWIGRQHPGPAGWPSGPAARR